MRILAVDDDRNNLKMIAFLLREEGYEVITTDNGKEALELVDSQHPDLVILDVMMPQIDGFEVCRRIRQTMDVPIIILSAKGEQNPQLAWKVNIEGLINVLEVGRERGLSRIFVPSSIAVFGPETPRNPAPQETVLRPTTMYGVTKVTGELLGDYYVSKYGLDVRGVRYPGIISSETLPGGGTTDYAVEVFYEALKTEHYDFFVRADTVLPMMYMPDCIRATIELMEADFDRLRHHCDFNLAGMSFSAEELAVEIKKHIPDFTYNFRPDFRQEIADSWPKRIDDTPAREEWGWKPKYDLSSMVKDMLDRLRRKLERQDGGKLKGRS